MDALIKTIHVPSKMVLLVFDFVVHSVTREASESAWEPLGDVPEQVCGIGIFCFLLEVVKYQKSPIPSHSKKKKKGEKDNFIDLNVHSNSVI